MWWRLLIGLGIWMAAAVTVSLLFGQVVREMNGADEEEDPR